MACPRAASDQGEAGMRRVLLAVGIVLLSSASAATASAETAPLPPLPAPATAPAPAPNGLAVVAMAGAADAAWPLAREIYATPSLRPYGVDEAHARVLAGEPPIATASPEVRDLAETVGGVHGEDGASRAIL